MEQNNQLMVKEVNFNGANLMACKSSDNGKVYVGVKWVCEGIGLSEGQIKNERVKLRDDLVLKQGGRNLILPTNGGQQEILCIEVDFLPLWLAKISITPKMIEKTPQITQKLVEYQLKAKDVLANAFIDKINKALESYLDMSEEDRAIAYFQKSKENKKLQLQLEGTKKVLEENEGNIEMAKKLTETNNSYDIGKFSKILNIKGLGRNNFYEYLRDKKILMTGNTPYQSFIKYFKVIAIDNAYQSTKTLIRVNGIKYVIKKLIEDGYLAKSFDSNKVIEQLEQSI